MKIFNQLPKETKERIFRQVATEKGLPVFAVEKDWWVVQVLRVVFSTDAANALLFKGGTSLSKAWALIDRFSEDVDLAIDRKFFRVEDAPQTNKKLRKLREKSRKYITEDFLQQLKTGFASVGINDIDIQYLRTASSSADPTQIAVNYPYVTEHTDYLLPRVLLEIGSRSMMEPSEEREIQSLVSTIFSDKDFADSQIIVNTVLPERTFLEKVFLLHEEFQKPKEDIRVKRMSRHIYDLEKMMQAGIDKDALTNIELYQDIVLHRLKMTKMKDVDYKLHQPQTINPLPPDWLLEDYKKDYAVMCEEMIYGDKLSWENLNSRIRTLQVDFNSQDWKVDI